MKNLNDKIAEILKQHPEGEDFFDTFDAMVRGDMDVLASFIHFVDTNVYGHNNYTLILTGQFGLALMNNYGKHLKEKFDDVILVNGGIRSGNKAIIFKDSLPRVNCVMLDDSFYSGTTRDSIEAALKEIDGRAEIVKTIVVYDGSVERDPRVISMFRYHD